jgi:threonine synthase
MNQYAHLRCSDCGLTYDLTETMRCTGCTAAGKPGTLEVAYDYDQIAGVLERDFWERRGSSLWQYGKLLPPGEAGIETSLGEGNGPLVRSRHHGPAWGMEQLYFKNDTVSPTWSHKDRFHAVAAAMGKTLGYRRLVTSSTGNHGASATAFGRAAGMTALVLCPPQVSRSLLDLIQTFGGQVIVTDWDARDEMGRYLVETHGWYPATGLDPVFAFSPNPYGIEGQKTFAYEIVRDLGRCPDAVFVPCAGGDTFYGIWKGFRELLRFGAIARLPRMYACQPAGAAALKQTLEQNLAEPAVLDEPDSIATSVRERTVGIRAVQVVRESHGGAPIATDEEIMDAVGLLGQEGICGEPASALPLACVRNMVLGGEIDPGETVVTIVTAAGIKWPEVLARTGGEVVPLAGTIAALEGWLQRERLL